METKLPSASNSQATGNNQKMYSGSLHGVISLTDVHRKDGDLDRLLSTSLENLEFSGFGHGLGSALHLQLAVNIAEVSFHGSNRYDQFLSNFLI